MSDDRIFTRRDFIRNTACGTAALALGLQGGCRGGGEGRAQAAARQQQGTTKVVLVRHPEAMDDAGAYNAEVIEGMLDDAVTELFGVDDPVEAWRGLVGPRDVLGIKSNVWRYLPTPGPVEQWIRRRAIDAGVLDENISIRDRGVLDDPIFQRATALANARPLRAHHWSGIGGCIKNYIPFVRQPWTYHGDSCADLGALWKLPIVEGKTRLNILVVMRPQFYNLGPHHFDTQYIWPYKGLLVGTDPVALDALGVELLAAKRSVFFDEEPRGGTSTRHVGLADTRHGIGISDRARIELVKLGWAEDILI